jgi:hypothetical protein
VTNTALLLAGLLLRKRPEVIAGEANVVAEHGDRLACLGIT